MEKIYRILLGIFLVCLIPILLVLSYWSCRYSYYGTVDYSIRNLLIKDSTWKHFVIFLLTSVLVYEGDKWLNAQNQEKQEKMCIRDRIFYVEKKVIAYSTLGIGRLIYQLPVNLCKIFIEEIFGDNVPMDLDEETLNTPVSYTHLIMNRTPKQML